jgi:hypothetical protein
MPPLCPSNFKQLSVQLGQGSCLDRAHANYGAYIKEHIVFFTRPLVRYYSSTALTVRAFLDSLIMSYAT